MRKDVKIAFGIMKGIFRILKTRISLNGVEMIESGRPVVHCMIFGYKMKDWMRGYANRYLVMKDIIKNMFLFKILLEWLLGSLMIYQEWDLELIP